VKASAILCIEIWAVATSMTGVRSLVSLPLSLSLSLPVTGDRCDGESPSQLAT
jgi:hypothetical protein